MTERSLDVATLELELQTQGVDGLRDKKILELVKNGKVTPFGRTAYFRLPKKVEQRIRAAVAD
jgi:putative transposon-encoded protein